jgi:hypothetical protein
VEFTLALMVASSRALLLGAAAVPAAPKAAGWRKRVGRGKVAAAGCLYRWKGSEP